jgi:phosphatidylserine/phosphatidylglycerophosphate/cardiolipin synthase-like enzyme
VVLPAKANNGQDDTRGQLSILAEADDHAGRFLAATIRARSGDREDPLYVHAKVGIVDDRWLTVGSANLNAHSLLNDTEMNVVTDDADLARATRERLWAEHLELDPGAVAGEDPTTLVDEHWRPIAAEQLERRERGLPPTHRLIALPGVSKRSARFLGPLQGLTDDG